MFVRALLLFTATLLLIAAISSVVAPRELRSGHGAAALSAAANNKTPPPRPGDARVLTLKAPRSKPLVANVGDVIRVQASAEAQDVAEFPDLGMDSTVSPGIPAQFDVIADRPGTFPLKLRYSGKRIGVLEVKPAS
ncbi:MAG TPA: hypothetical protein VFZ89_11940 [Solirubrobacteraceae bacterium]